MAGSRGGSREMHWKMHSLCWYHQVGLGQEGSNPSPPSGDTAPAPLPGLCCSMGPASPYPSEKRRSPKTPQPQNLARKTTSARVCAEPETTAWQLRTLNIP